MRPELWSGPWPSRPCGSSSATSERLAPLRLTGRDELVDDRLGAVDEVAELRLPQHQRVGVGHRVAVLEADGGELRQRRVVGQEAALALGQVAQRVVLLAGLAGRSAPSAAARTCRAGSPGRTAGPAGRPRPASPSPAARRTPSRRRPRGTSSRRLASTGSTRWCTAKPSGQARRARRRSGGRPPAGSRCRGRRGRAAPPRPRGETTGGVFSSSRTSLNTCSSWLEKSLSACSASSMVMSPRPISDSV